MDYYTTAEAAARLHITPGRVLHLLTAGKLRGQKFGPVWMVEAASVEERLANPTPPGRAKKEDK